MTKKPKTELSILKMLLKVRSLVSWSVKNFFDWLTLRILIAWNIFFRRKKQKKSILLIKPDNIGDHVLLEPYLSDILACYNEKEHNVDFLVNSKVKPLVSFMEKNNLTVNGFQNILYINRDKYKINLFYRFRFNWKINSLSYDSIVYLSYSRNRDIDQLIRVAQVEKKIGIDGDDGSMPLYIKNENNVFYTDLLVFDQKIEHESNLNRLIVEKLTKQKIDLKLPDWSISETVKSQAFNKLSQKLNLKGKEYILICPEATTKIREWEDYKFSKLIDRLLLKYDSDIIITGVRKKTTLWENIEHKEVHRRVFDLSGELSLSDFIMIIANSKLMIGLCSGPAHIAHALKVPTFTIVGGGQIGRFLPYVHGDSFSSIYLDLDCIHCNWNCIYKQAHCLSDISVEMVEEKLENMLSNI